MFSLLVFAMLCTSCMAGSLVHFSFSPAVGGGSGTSFSTKGQGRITAVRVWEIPGSYIAGMQLRYEYVWSNVIGRKYNDALELNLFDGETIIQVSGKYHTNFIYQLIFMTSKGRSLVAGQPYQRSFNFYPIHMDAELRLLSGRFTSSGITSLAAHWGAVYMDQSNSTDIST